MSTPEAARWQKTRAAFEAVLEAPEASRSERVEEICADDRELMAEVLSLLEAHTEAEGYFDALSEAIDDAVPHVDDPARWLGTFLDGYLIVELIGRGGMGMVFRAEPVGATGGSAVAIKVLTGGTTHEVALERFRREQDRSARLEHPFIVRVLDSGETRDGALFHVMELIDGEPIDRYADRLRLNPEQRVRLVIKVCEAVTHAHDHDVIHRDLKPGNILVRESGEPALLDFDIAKLLDPLSMDPSTMSMEVRSFTPAYASPEQMLGRVVSPASDVYALGVLLYELLAGATPPFTDAPRRRSPTQVLTRSKASGEELAARRSTTLDALELELEGELGSVMQTACALDREARYPSVEALVEALEACLQGGRAGAGGANGR